MEKLSEQDTQYHARMVARVEEKRIELVKANKDFERSAGAIEVWFLEYAIEKYGLNLQAGDRINLDGTIVRGSTGE